jgi:two-component system chemotaxis sensor kinase CheA
VESTVGEGTTVRLALPVSVAISEVLFMEVGDEEYGVPIRVVDEIEGMNAAQPVTDGGEVVRTGGQERQLIDLGEAMDAQGRAPDRQLGGPQGDGMLVTLEDDVREAAIRCDRVRGQQEVVVKPFEGFMADIPGLSGAAILGEGDVVNILDVETL